MGNYRYYSIKRNAWGYIIYNRPLTQAEADQYELLGVSE